MNTIVCPPIYCIDEYPMYIEHTRIIISEPIHKIFMVFIVFTWLNYTDSVCSYLKHSRPSSLLGFTATIMVFRFQIWWFYHYVPNISKIFTNFHEFFWKYQVRNFRIYFCNRRYVIYAQPKPIHKYVIVQLRNSLIT